MLNKKYLFIIALMFLINAIFVQAETFGYGKTENIPINYSNIIINETSNQSEYWNTNIGSLNNVNSTQFSNNGETLNILESWLNSFVIGLSKWDDYLLLSGGTMSGDIDMGGNDIINSGNITANYFFGNGSQLTGLPETTTYWDRTGTTLEPSTSGDNVETTGTGTFGKGIFDVTDTEALLIRKDGDSGDIFVVDTTNTRLGFNAVPSHLYSVVMYSPQSTNPF
ncbi:MAG: hypothetical protein DRN27_07735, partial [Thermoplasmata archaeon]